MCRPQNNNYRRPAGASGVNCAEIRTGGQTLGTVIIHGHTRVGTGLHCTVLVTAHCRALKTGIGIVRIVPSALVSDVSGAEVIFVLHASRQAFGTIPTLAPIAIQCCQCHPKLCHAVTVTLESLGARKSGEDSQRRTIARRLPRRRRRPLLYSTWRCYIDFESPPVEYRDHPRHSGVHQIGNPKDSRTQIDLEDSRRRILQVESYNQPPLFRQYQ